MSLRFARDAEDDVPYRFGGGFDVLPVGAIHNVFGENLWLAKQSPVNKM